MKTSEVFSEWAVLHGIFQIVANGAKSPPKDWRYNSNIGMALQDLANDGHGRNVAAGWWTDIATGLPKERNTGELLMLAVSELAEVPPHPHAILTMDDKLPNRLMAEVEIADCIIRLLDTAGARKVDLRTCYMYLNDSVILVDPHCSGYNDLDLGLMFVVRCISDAMEGDRKSKMLTCGDQKIAAFEIGITLALCALFRIGAVMAFDLPGAIVEKMRFNSVRADHKIEARKADDGKKY